jgi:hypothetical protein
MDKFIATFMLAFVLLFVLALIGAVFTQWGWNGSIAQIFHLSDLTFMQAFWLNVLGGMVCKGSSGGSSK